MKQIELAHRKLFHDANARSGLNWFYWIALLSIVNSAISLFGKPITFVVGLGVTQRINAWLSVSPGTEGADGLRLLSFGINVVIAGVFAGIGFLGHKNYRGVVAIGIALYALDALIFVTTNNWSSVAFHVIVLWGMGRGFLALARSKKFDDSGVIVVSTNSPTK